MNYRESSNHKEAYDQHKSSYRHHPLSRGDEERKKIAEKNHQFVNDHYPDLQEGMLIDNDKHESIKKRLASEPPLKKDGKIFVNDNSSIWSAIDCHKRSYKHIYILNFADAIKPGGGYLNGRNAQEECLCRQTLLYPTISGSKMYEQNKRIGPESDYMIYSKNVLVFREDDNERIKRDSQFSANIISAAAYDNRNPNDNSNQIMDQRIRKIINLAAVNSVIDNKEDPGKSALILGAFGCGVFKNDPNIISSIFSKILNEDKLKHYFDCVIFPIYKSHNMIHIFEQNLLNK